MEPGASRGNTKPKTDAKVVDPKRSRRADEDINPYGNKDDLIESFINSYRSVVPERTERTLPHQAAQPEQIGDIAGSKRELATTLSSLPIAELTRQCVSAFKSCVLYGSLMKHQWAENRFADFNLFVDGVGALSSSKASLDSRFKSRPDDLVLIKSILAMLQSFLEQYIRSAEAQMSTDEAMENVDSSLDNLALIAIAVRRTGSRSRLERADRTFKPEQHAELRDLLRNVCFRQHTRKDAGEDREMDGFRFAGKSTQECIDASKEFILSEPQQRLIENNMRRRNRFLQAQEHSRKLKARESEESAHVGDPREELAAEISRHPEVEIVSEANLVKTTTGDPGKELARSVPNIPETMASTAEGSFHVQRVKKNDAFTARDDSHHHTHSSSSIS